jgi:hypothetical protein
MKTKNEEAERLEAVNVQLSQKIVDLEAEIERNHKALEGFMAENEALKAELGGKRKPDSAGETVKPGKPGSVVETTAPVEKHGGRQGNSIDAVAIWRRLQEGKTP